jgi:tetratricopeptide (TPR) repeat protein
MTLEWDWAAAEAGFERALELDPSYLWGRQVYADFLVYQGRLDEALEQLTRIEQLDPLAVSPGPADIGVVLALKGDIGAAVNSWKSVLELSPTHYSSLLNLGTHYCVSGRAQEGVALLTRARELYPETPFVLTHIAVCHANAGQVDEARRFLGELEEWERTEYVDPVNLAAVHVSLGEEDEAFTWLERGYEVRAFLLTQLRTLRGIDPLRSDPRYDDLLRRINHPEAS